MGCNRGGLRAKRGGGKDEGMDWDERALVDQSKPASRNHVASQGRVEPGCNA